jgi:proline iminopeptidase
MNPNVYVYMQGPSEFGITGDASLKDWDVTAQLTLTVPTLVIGANMTLWIQNIWNGCLKKFKTGTFYCAQMEVSAQYDDQKSILKADKFFKRRGQRHF